MRRPAVPPAAGILLGVVAGSADGSVSVAAMACAVAAGVVAVAGGAVARGRVGAAPVALYVGFCVAGGLLGATARAERDPPLGSWFEATRAVAGPGFVSEIEGRLRHDAMPTEYGASLVVDVTRVGRVGRTQSTNGTVRLAVGGTLVPSRIDEWRSGRTVRLPARLRWPARYANVGVPNEADRLSRRGVTVLGSVTSALLVEVVGPASWPREWASRSRAVVRRAVGTTVGAHDRRSAAIVTAVLIGDRAGLDHETTDRLQQAGTYHVIAISGGNIAILTGACLVGLRLGGVTGRPAAVIAIVALVVYGQVVAPEASVSRAIVAAVIFLSARACDHRIDPLNTLAVVAGGLVAVDPSLVFDPGFHLTFGATTGILLGVPRLVDAMSRSRSGWLGNVGVAAFGLLAATVCAEAALFPIAASHFSRVSVAGLVLNFAAIPLMAVTQLAGMAAVALEPGHAPTALAAGWVAHLAATGIVESAAVVTWLPWLVWRLPAPHPGLAAIYYAGWLVWFAAARAPRLRYGALALVVTSGAAMLLAPLPGLAALRAGAVCGPATGPRAERLRIHFLDVDQGDATLVLFPNGRSLLVDAGGQVHGRFDVGSRVVVPAAWALGVRRLDYLVITHADPDHVGGAPAVVRDLRPREIWDGIAVPASHRWAALMTDARERGVTWRTIRGGDRLTVGQVEVDVLHPEGATWERPRVRNDDSVVLALRYHDVSVVLPGDIGADVESRIVARPWRPARHRVVKVPHHGSRSSSSDAFVARLQPTVAIVSAGRENRFGHPDPAVVRRYERAGATVRDTSRDGAVALCTDGRSMTVSGTVSPPVTFADPEPR